MSSGAPKTILYVTTHDWVFLSNRLPMARAARDAGFGVHVATHVEDKADAIRAEGFTLHPIPFRRGLSPLAMMSTIAALRTIEQALKPDIIHHVGLQISVAGGLAALGNSIPQINAMTGLGYTFTGSSMRARVLRFAISIVLRFLLNRDKSFTLVQNPDDRAALENIGIDAQRISLIPGSGVDTDALQPLPEPDGAVTVGFAGRLLTEKGIRALVAAHRILRGRNVAVDLLIAGEPDPANPASVTHAEAQSWNREPGISWLGHLPDITALWKRSHIAALPSHREGLPKALLEAAACGRPLIAADAPGCREIAVDGQTGLLVPVEAPEALADAIARLAASKELRQRLGAAARALAVDKMSARSVGLQTVALYNRAMMGR
ncbi:MAG: glycosyltransferase family 4 protein [Afipia sp.]|nr:glycosyltransferase family 4 protein [Afipia sp.]